MVAGNRAESCEEDVELVRLWKLGLEKAALCCLRTRGFCRERHAKDGRLRRVALQVQFEQLKQQVAALRSDGGTDVPLVGRGFLQLQEKGEATQRIGAFDRSAHDAFEHRRHNEEQRVQKDKRHIECRASSTIAGNFGVDDPKCPMSQ